MCGVFKLLRVAVEHGTVLVLVFKLLKREHTAVRPVKLLDAEILGTVARNKHRYKPVADVVIVTE